VFVSIISHEFSDFSIICPIDFVSYNAGIPTENIASPQKYSHRQKERLTEQVIYEIEIFITMLFTSCRNLSRRLHFWNVLGFV